jgi:hypothetical protein
MEQAIAARKSQKNVLADRQRLGKNIEGAAFGTENQIRHAPGHILEDGSRGLPHFQTEKKLGHTFWGRLSVAGASIAGALDQVANAAEYIPDPSPSLAEQSDIDRANSVIDWVNESVGIAIPQYSDVDEGRIQRNIEEILRMKREHGKSEDNGRGE